MDQRAFDQPHTFKNSILGGFWRRGKVENEESSEKEQVVLRGRKGVSQENKKNHPK